MGVVFSPCPLLKRLFLWREEFCIMRKFSFYFFILFFGLFLRLYSAEADPVARVVLVGDEVNAERELGEAEKEVDLKVAAILAAGDTEEVGALVDGEELLGDEAQALVEEQEKTAVAVGRPLDVGFKKTITIPRLNRSFAVDTSQMSVPGFGRLIFEAIKDAKSGQELLRGRPEKDPITWGPVRIARAQFILNPVTQDLTFNASIFFLQREVAQASVEKFTEDGRLLIKCLLPNPILIPISPWATFVVDAFYLENNKGDGTLKVHTKAVLKQHPDVKIDIVFLKDKEKGTVLEGSLEQLLLSHVVAPIASTPFNKITLNKIKLRISSLNQPAEGQLVTKGASLEGVANFGGLLSSLPIKVNSLACNVVLGAPNVPFALTAKIPESIDLIPSLVALTEPTVVLQFAEPPAAGTLSRSSLEKEKETIKTVDDAGKKIMLQLLGSVKLSLPQVGSVSAKLVSLFKFTGKEKGFTSFTGTLEKPISYADKVSLDNCQLVLSRRAAIVPDDEKQTDKKSKADSEQVKTDQKKDQEEHDKSKDEKDKISDDGSKQKKEQEKSKDDKDKPKDKESVSEDKKEAVKKEPEKTKDDKDDTKEKKEKTKSAFKLVIRGDGTVNAEDITKILPKIPGVDIKPLLRQKLAATLEVVQSPKGISFVFEGLLAMTKPFKPFEKVPGLEKLQAVRDIEINRLGVGFDSSKNFYLMGDSRVLGLDSRAKVIKTVKGVVLNVKPLKDPRLTDLIPSSSGTAWGEVEPKDLQLIVSTSRFFFEDMNVMLGKGITVLFDADLRKKPFNRIREALQKQKVDSSKLAIPDFVRMVGTLSPSLHENQVSANLALNFEIKPGLVFKDLVLALGGIPPSVFVKGNLFFTPEGQEDPLMFTGMLQVSPVEALEVSIAGSMVGEWIDPLGLKGFAIRDVGAELGLSFSVLLGAGKKVVGGGAGGAGGGAGGGVAGGVTAVPAAPGGAAGGTAASSAVPDPITLSKVGMTGNIDFGEQSIGVTARIVPEMWYKIILGGHLKQLYITDIIKEVSLLPQKMQRRMDDAAKKGSLKEAKKISQKTQDLLQKNAAVFKSEEFLKKIPNLRFEDLEFYFAPIGGQIGEIYFEPGLRLKGKMLCSLFQQKEFKAKVDVNIQLIPASVRVIGTMDPITVAGLDITGLGSDGVQGTSDDGPVIDVQVSAEKQQAVVSGLTNFMDSKAEVKLFATPLGGEFKIFAKLAKRFNLKIEGSTTTAKVTGYLENDFTNFIKEQVVKHLDVGSQFAEVSKLNDINKRVEDLERRISDKNREIEESKNKFTENVSMQSFTRKETRTIGSGRFSKTISIDVPDVRRIVNRIPFDIAPLVAQRSAMEVERTELRSQQKALQAVVDGLTGVKVAGEKLATSFEISQASIEGNLIEMSRGTGSLSIKGRALGIDFDVAATLDTNDMGKMTDEIVKKVKGKFSK